MKIDYGTENQVLFNWIRVGWILNLCFAILIFLFSDQYLRAVVCLLSSGALASVYFVSRKWVAMRISFLVYLLLCFTEWLWLSYKILNTADIFIEGRPHSFLLNIIVIVTPFLYAGLRWIIAFLMMWALWKTGKAKRKG